MVVVDFEFLEVLFDRLNLGRIKDVLTGAYHRFGPACMHHARSIALVLKVFSNMRKQTRLIFE